MTCTKCNGLVVRYDETFCLNCGARPGRRPPRSDESIRFRWAKGRKGARPGGHRMGAK